MEVMGMVNGSDGDGQWKRWGRSMEVMGMVNGSDGDGQWNLMEMSNGRYSRISPANRVVSCGSDTLAYVVHVLLNAFVCTSLHNREDESWGR
jgi:hypothetical protein